jgi:hypothetical protein
MGARKRPAIDLDGQWAFNPDPERLLDPASLPDGEPIRVPGSWEGQVGRPYRIVRAWYHRAVGIPDDWRGKRVLLRFGAVMYRCTVYVNGQAAGRHEGGYTPFTFDVADHVRWGEENQIAVEVVNPMNAIIDYPAFSVDRVLLAEEFEPDVPLSQAPHGKQTWYSSMSGIWQSVEIEAVPEIYLAPVRALPDVPGECAVVRWTLLGALPDARRPTALEFAVTGPGGAVVSTTRVELGDDEAGQATVAVPDPQLWDIGQPNLYGLEARLIDGDEVVDVCATRFGMRSIGTRDGQLLLNGRPIYMLGALDQDLYPDEMGAPPSREFLDAQMQRTRELGINLLRCHIKVPDPAYLEAADEAGILVWCELPNWTTFTHAAAARGRETLATMVQELGNHPSIVIWTIINEDWGTQLRYEARDRYWLARMYERLKEMDPTRLVVDNSACETPETPNFHVRTDIADFHIYFGIPDNAVRWRNAVADFARRPAWLWSPHGDARPRGDEPLILSEFGNWGLPRLDRIIPPRGRDPWWFTTGLGYYRPAGLARRFRSLGLDRIWPDVNALADATQWHQFEAMQFEIGEMRRHDSIKGYVITELTDAYWEANGLLDIHRGHKVYHDRMRELNSLDMAWIDLARRDVCSEDPLRGDVYLSSYEDAPSGGGRVRWSLDMNGRAEFEGSIDVTDWPAFGSRRVGAVEASIPDVDEPSDADLVLTVEDRDGHERARTSLRMAVLPKSSRVAAAPLRVRVHDPEEIWRIAARLESLGHTVTESDSFDLLVSSEVTDDVIEHVEDGGRALVLVRARNAVPTDAELARRVSVHLRRLPHAGWPGQRSPWEGDWVTSFSWIDPDAFDGLPKRNPLDFAYEEVLPDHVLLGYEPDAHAAEVSAGMFVGWVHAPAAHTWTFRQGRGALTLTTFRVSPENGPVASALLKGLLERAARADRRWTEREAVGVPA